MRSACLAWLVVAGCGFSSQPVAGGGPGLGPDAAGGDPAGGPISRCDASDASLRLCLTFDETPLVQDLALPPHALVDAVGVSAIVGIASGTLGATGGTGIQLDATSRVRFAESADLDVSDFTFDLWIDPARISPKQSFWLFDNNTQYFASYEDDDAVRCGIASQTAQSRVKLGGGWHHVACRYDTATHELRAYLDGDVSRCTIVPGGVPTTGTDGLAIGANYGATGYQDHFSGRIDGLHLYARALADAEICRAAGKTSCATTCPE